MRFVFIVMLFLALCFNACSKMPFLNYDANYTANPGYSAHDFLSADSYTKLTIEIQSVSGFGPTTQAQNQLIAFLQTYLNKPDGIQIINETIPSPGRSSYSLDDVRKIENANRTHFNSGSEMTAYFLFLDGTSTSDSSSGQILGMAYGPTSMVIFEKTIQNLSGGIGQPPRQVLESTVIEHEFGHLLGLVNTGTPMKTPHQDSAHGAHCDNTSCLMYYQTDTSNIINNILGGNVPTLDANCVNDLKANGGK